MVFLCVCGGEGGRAKRCPKKKKKKKKNDEEGFT